MGPSGPVGRFRITSGIRAQATLGTWCLIRSSCNLVELPFGLGSQDSDGCDQGGAIGIWIVRQFEMTRITPGGDCWKKCGLD